MGGPWAREEACDFVRGRLKRGVCVRAAAGDLRPSRTVQHLATATGARGPVMTEQLQVRGLAESMKALPPATPLHLLGPKMLPSGESECCPRSLAMTSVSQLCNCLSSHHQAFGPDAVRYEWGEGIFTPWPRSPCLHGAESCQSTKGSKRLSQN